MFKIDRLAIGYFITPLFIAVPLWFWRNPQSADLASAARLAEGNAVITYCAGFVVLWLWTGYANSRALRTFQGYVLGCTMLCVSTVFFPSILYVVLSYVGGEQVSDTFFAFVGFLFLVFGSFGTALSMFYWLMFLRTKGSRDSRRRN